MGDLIDQRRLATERRINELRESLVDAERLCGDKACVYVTGSFARGEASIHSDLDLFIVGLCKGGRRQLSRLDEICIKADLIESTQRFDIPDFSGDGEYLEHYSIDDLIKTMGTPHDDANNTFTARLLMLLESRPLLGAEVYREVTEHAIWAYWKDYEDHKNDFIPAFLANDILRLWRTFCVNYEARTSKEPEERRAKRKLKNYKLKHSRLLTCYSALLYLLAIHSHYGTVRPSDAAEMISLTPTERLEWLLSKQTYADAHQGIRDLLSRYENFLSATECPEDELVRRFLDGTKRRESFPSPDGFGNAMFDVLDCIGKKNRFYRLLVV